jgi:hypothetical protein
MYRGVTTGLGVSVGKAGAEWFIAISLRRTGTDCCYRVFGSSLFVVPLGSWLRDWVTWRSPTALSTRFSCSCSAHNTAIWSKCSLDPSDVLRARVLSRRSESCSALVIS